jgi:glyoxylase-like metal-dependent hydrolase (beta-lactamase superfamily II)
LVIITPNVRGGAPHGNTGGDNHRCWVTEVTEPPACACYAAASPMEILPGIHHFNTDPFNWYVLEESNRLTVVDAGFPGHYGVFRRGLESIGRTIRDIEAIIITHAHADHMGFAHRLQQETGAPVFVHASDASAVGRSYQLPWWGLLSNAWRPFMAATLTRATVNGVFWAPGIASVRKVQQGDLLDVPGRPRIIHAPGHTPGQIALHLPRQQVLLSSDVLITQHLLTGVHGAPQLAHPVLNHDSDQARRSLERLRDLGEVTLLPGHGRPWKGKMADAIAATAKA